MIGKCEKQNFNSAKMRAVSLASVLAVIVGVGLLLIDTISLEAMRKSTIAAGTIGTVVLMVNIVSGLRMHGMWAKFAFAVATVGFCIVVLSIWALF